MALLKESKAELQVDAASADEVANDLVVNTQPSPKATSFVADDLPAHLVQNSCRLHAAAYRGNIKLMIEILQEDNARMSSRRRAKVPLGNIGINAVVEEYAEIKDSDEIGSTALMVALQAGQSDSVKFLLQRKADVNKTREDGFSPLHYAASSASLKYVSVLCEAGAAVDACDKECGGTALHFAVLESDPDIVKELLEYQADINAPDAEGASPLHLCAAAGDLKMVKLLAMSKADLDVEDNAGTTALFAACSENHIETVRELIHAGADVDKAKDGATPLCIAIQEEFSEVMELLLQSGAKKERAHLFSYWEWAASV